MLLHNFQEPYQVIDTFGENDFVGVVLFNNAVEEFHHQLVPMTPGDEGNHAKIKAYIEENYCTDCSGGGTNKERIKKMKNNTLTF